MKSKIFFRLLATCAISAGPLQAAELMSDEELELTTARGYDAEVVNGDTLNFNFSGLGANGAVNGSGNMQLREIARQARGANSVIISDNAQSNLNALVNVNAADAIIQVLMNLNININSEVHGLIQNNAITGK